MLSAPWIAVPVALFLWWFSTGAILWVVRRTEDEGGKQAAMAALPLLMGGCMGVWLSLERGDVGGAYLGFAAALAVWGWIELAFLTGLITGPNGYPCPPDAIGIERFVRAWGTIAYHEILLILVLAVFIAISWGQLNPIAFWTFAILFGARITAKLNLFFGVPKINIEFLPTHLAHLPSHFRIARMNWFFPISVTALSVLVAGLVALAGHAETQGGTVGYVLLATLSALALLEHWLLVLPLPDAKLWRWMLPEPKSLDLNTKREGRHGV